jgi:hypothetical protein
MRVLDNGINIWYYKSVNSKQQKTFELIFKNPVPSNILWPDIESLLAALGAETSEGTGSRLRVKLNGVRAVFHRPHPQKTTDKGAVSSVRRFLENAGAEP